MISLLSTLWFRPIHGAQSETSDSFNVGNICTRRLSWIRSLYICISTSFIQTDVDWCSLCALFFSAPVHTFLPSLSVLCATWLQSFSVWNKKRDCSWIFPFGIKALNTKLFCCYLQCVLSSLAQAPCPQEFFKIKQFSRNFNGKTPILSNFWAQGPPLGLKLHWPPHQNPGSVPRSTTRKMVWNKKVSNRKTFYSKQRRLDENVKPLQLFLSLRVCPFQWKNLARKNLW